MVSKPGLITSNKKFTSSTPVGGVGVAPLRLINKISSENCRQLNFDNRMSNPSPGATLKLLNDSNGGSGKKPVKNRRSSGGGGLNLSDFIVDQSSGGAGKKKNKKGKRRSLETSVNSEASSVAPPNNNTSLNR